jgi:hypothetical protein
MLAEGLVLKRLAAVPKRRQQEWLRLLLVNGLLWESRTIGETARLIGSDEHAALPTAAPVRLPRLPSVGRVGGGPGRGVKVAERPARDALSRSEEPPAEKPFAHLRKVLG